MASVAAPRQLDVAAELAVLPEIREHVRQAAAAFGMAGLALEDLLVAVDEAATNIVKHGYRGQPGRLNIVVERNADTVEVQIRDTARHFDPRGEAPPNLDVPLPDRPVGGMGIHLMRTLTDGMAWRPVPTGGNEITLAKRLAR